MGGLIEFQTGPIADIGSQTMNQKAVWDGIWESTKARISATAAEALDAATGIEPGGARPGVQPQVHAVQPERAAAGPGREPDRLDRHRDQRPDGQHHPRRRLSRDGARRRSSGRGTGRATSPSTPGCSRRRETLMARRPEQPAKDPDRRVDASRPAAFGTVPGRRRRRGPDGRLDRADPDPVSAGSGPRWPTSRWPRRTAKELATDAEAGDRGDRPARADARTERHGGGRPWQGASPRRGRRSSACGPEMLRAKAEQLRQFGIDAGWRGSQLAASADEVGAQRGAPYAAYRDRVTPTATWLRDLESPANTTADGLDGAAGAGDRARMVLAQQEQMLAELAVRPTTTRRRVRGGRGAGVGRGEPGHRRGDPGVRGHRAAGARHRAGGGRRAGGAAPGRAPALRAPAGPGVRGRRRCGRPRCRAPRTAAARCSGRRRGRSPGSCQDPTTGNLIDPATGREVDAGGRFLDPITGQPFGDAVAVRHPAGGAGGRGGRPAPGWRRSGPVRVRRPAAGLIGPAAGPGAGRARCRWGRRVRVRAAGSCRSCRRDGGASGRWVAAGRGARRFAGLYGGTVPPSLVGPNPADRELSQTAAHNLEHRAAVAQRYAAIASGQAAGAGSDSFRHR